MRLDFSSSVRQRLNTSLRVPRDAPEQRQWRGVNHNEVMLRGERAKRSEGKEGRRGGQTPRGPVLAEEVDDRDLMLLDGVPLDHAIAREDIAEAMPGAERARERDGGLSFLTLFRSHSSCLSLLSTFAWPCTAC